MEHSEWLMAADSQAGFYCFVRAEEAGYVPPCSVSSKYVLTKLSSSL